MGAGAGVIQGLIVFLVSGKYISEADLENHAKKKKKSAIIFNLIAFLYCQRLYIQT